MGDIRSGLVGKLGDRTPLSVDRKGYGYGWGCWDSRCVLLLAARRRRTGRMAWTLGSETWVGGSWLACSRGDFLERLLLGVGCLGDSLVGFGLRSKVVLCLKILRSDLWYC